MVWALTGGHVLLQGGNVWMSLSLSYIMMCYSAVKKKRITGLLQILKELILATWSVCPFFLCADMPTQRSMKDPTRRACATAMGCCAVANSTPPHPAYSLASGYTTRRLAMASLTTSPSTLQHPSERAGVSCLNSQREFCVCVCVCSLYQRREVHWYVARQHAARHRGRRHAVRPLLRRILQRQ